MALNGNNWGVAVASAVKAAAASITPGTPVTDEQLEAVWKAVKNADTTHITTQAVTSTPGAASGGSTLPGTIT